ncbi:hypothetical protein [Limnohabitans sp. JirII-31]|uniref:hypothetical protein n=1 Tax=Limnohabitans sp. JirII-31 TaxID=1977908 RepID=UPI000C1ED6D2|nr:hypothetical protein [Limnohabitans sp. JirII-31]PIT75128.1 hypothetical protein B9Z41_11930 [Limnohabitans sp. JirII-31]
MGAVAEVDMGIKQFNGEWVSQEDRVLFRFNTHENEEFCVWLTRRMVQGVLQGAQQLTLKSLEKTHSPEVAQVVQAFQQQSVAQQVKFSQSYEPATQKPLGEQPLLVKGLVMNLVEDQTQIEFQLVNGQSVNLSLVPHVLQVMVTLLNKLQQTAGWGVGLDALEPSAEPVATPPSHHVH